MSTTYDPHHPNYTDQADVRDELTRVFDVCHGCRRCVDLCSSFPTLFDMIDRHADGDAGRLTPAQQDRVVDECFQCKLCAVECPYAPEIHEANIDFPRMMLRARAMQHASGLTSQRNTSAKRVLGRADRVGWVATSVPGLANSIVGAEPDSRVRKLLATITGVSARRMLPSFASERFSKWFAQRPKIKVTRPQGSVTVFPTCLVEYEGTGVGKDLVRVYERNGVQCETTAAGCCGVAWLHSGDIERFGRVARKNIAMLADEVRRGTDIVVTQPTCGYVIKHDYVDHAGDPTARDDAQLVADHTYDAGEYLMRIHRADDTTLDTHFVGEPAGSIAYHTSCHLRAEGISSMSRDLLKLTGADVELVEQSSGIDGLWGLRASNEEVAVAISGRLGTRIEEAGAAVVAGDCHLSNTAIAEETGRRPRHPVQILARAYGIADDA